MNTYHIASETLSPQSRRSWASAPRPLLKRVRRVPVSLPETHWRPIEQLCRQEGVTLSGLVRRLLREEAARVCSAASPR